MTHSGGCFHSVWKVFALEPHGGVNQGDEHRHLNLGIPLNYYTKTGFVFTATPGILFRKETEWEAGPSIHLETLYEFTFERFHLGPMCEIAFASDDIHFMLGIHLGLGW